MPVKKYVKKSAKKAVVFAKKRYSTRTGGVRVAQLAKDVMKIKRSLNVEHKHFDYVFGALNGAQTTSQSPTNNDPITLALTLPVRGTAYNNRVGNQIKITHITSKIEFLFENNSDLFSRRTASVRLLFAKAGDDVPTIEDLYEQDQNGHYTRASFTNSQEWKKYAWIKSLNTFKSHTDQTDRWSGFAHGNDASLLLPNSSGAGVDQGSEFNDIANQSKSLAKYYVNKQTKCNIRVMFENGSDTIVTQMKPYLLLMCDAVVQSGATHDPVKITGQIRFTYVDN
ncbi:hypothetical protein [Shewanella sp.]|uniref:hypothetical protein n=1 Tax=Shewanella sp. TaxID=50422 RepID=UPI004048A106